MLVDPAVQRFPGQLRPVVTHDALRQTALRTHALEHVNDPPRRQRMRHLDRRTLAREIIHEGETSKRPTIEQGVAHEVHTPPLGPRRRLGSRPAGDRDVLRPPAATHRKTFFAVESQHFLVVDHVPFATQQHMQLLVAPPRLGGGELAQARAHHRIIATNGAILPTRATERDEATGASLTTLGEGGHEMGDDLRRCLVVTTCAPPRL